MLEPSKLAIKYYVNLLWASQIGSIFLLFNFVQFYWWGSKSQTGRLGPVRENSINNKNTHILVPEIFIRVLLLSLFLKYKVWVGLFYKQLWRPSGQHYHSKRNVENSISDTKKTLLISKNTNNKLCVLQSYNFYC